jgi:xanthine dehydrogenase accessory factor
VAIVGERVPLEQNVLAGMAALLDGERLPTGDLFDDLARWRRDRVRVTIARVVGIGGSASWEPHALAVNEQGEVVGSVPDGCAPAAVVAEALAVLELGHPKLVTFGRHGGNASSVGLISGGPVHLFLEPLDW